MEDNGGDREQGPQPPPRRIANLPTAVIRLGAVAAAIGSILALVATVAPGVLPGGTSTDNSDPGPATTNVQSEAAITLTLPKDAAKYATRQQYATTFLGDPHFYDDQPTLAHEPGVAVIFDLSSRGYPRGTRFPVIITLLEQHNGGVRGAGSSRTAVELDRPNDSCGCDEWVAIRRNARGPFTARIQLYPADKPDGSALGTEETELVRRPRPRPG